MKDKINPDYYTKGKIQTADFIEDKKLDYFEGNVVKYVVRHKEKNGKEDLEKALWYLKKMIARYK